MCACVCGKKKHLKMVSFRSLFSRAIKEDDVRGATDLELPPDAHVKAIVAV